MDIMVNGRIPPQAIEIEESVLGSCMMDTNATDYVLDSLAEADFYSPANVEVFKAIKSLHKKKAPIDPHTIEQELKDTNVFHYLPGGHIDEMSARCNIGSVEHDCQILKEKSIKRRIILDCSKIIEDAYDITDAYTVIDSLNKAADGVEGRTKHKHSLTPAEIFHREENEPVQEKLLFGDEKLDEGLYSDAGSRKGHVKLTIADSGHGKTSVGLWEAELLLKRGYRGAWFQLEDYDVNTARHFERNVPELMNNIHICHDLYEIEDIKREARKLNREYGLDFIVFDYVQNIEATKKTGAESVEYISKQITRMAKDLNVLCCPLSQVTLDYKLKRGWSLEPSKGHVRWSQQLKQDAHVIVSVFRPSEITELVANETQVKDWDDNLHPINSVWIKQAKVRYGKRFFKRYHLIHTDKGIKPYSQIQEYPF